MDLQCDIICILHGRSHTSTVLGVPVESAHIAWEVIRNLKVSILQWRSHTIMMRGVPAESVYSAWAVMHKAER